MIGSTIVGAPYSKGGLTTNTHATCDAWGNPTDFHLMPGQVHDLHGADALRPSLLTDMQALLADKAYDAMCWNKPAFWPSSRLEQ